MNVWTLELLRLWRTKRWLALLAAFTIFGFLGPIMARYISELIGSTAGNLTIIIPPPIPADGFTNYIKNSMQVGLIVAVVVAAGALAIDAKTGLSIFYKTRILQPAKLVLPRYVVVTLAVEAAFIIGTLVAWYETAILLGPVPPVQLLIGTLYICLYLAFAMAVVAVSGTVARSVIGTVGIALTAILFMPIIGIVHLVSKWVPSALVDSQDSLIRATSSASDYFPAVFVTIAATIALLAVTSWRINRRDLE